MVVQVSTSAIWVSTSHTYKNKLKELYMLQLMALEDR